MEELICGQCGRPCGVQDVLVCEECGSFVCGECGDKGRSVCPSCYGRLVHLC